MNRQIIWRRFALAFAVVMLLAAAFTATHFTSPSQITSVIDHGRIASGCPSIDAHCFGTRL